METTQLSTHQCRASTLLAEQHSRHSNQLKEDLILFHFLDLNPSLPPNPKASPPRAHSCRRWSEPPQTAAAPRGTPTRPRSSNAPHAHRCSLPQKVPHSTAAPPASRQLTKSSLESSRRETTRFTGGPVVLSSQITSAPGSQNYSARRVRHKVKTKHRTPQLRARGLLIGQGCPPEPAFPDCLLIRYIHQS